ncbi:MAG: tetratricopeptide repeat protein [Candidatus Pacebacteria bacterium]|nr:tetratricopeptide repeat protein [Candidatus Paceibacterota bacterium]
MAEFFLSAGFILLLGFVTGCNAMVYLFFKKEQEIAKAMPAQKILKLAKKLYADGKYDESVALIKKNKVSLTGKEEIAEANRILGWDYYYISIKGPVATRKGNLKLAELSFREALNTRNKSRKISCLNGLPLALWLLDKKPETWSVINKAVASFSEEPSVWNTKAITLRREGRFAESVQVCEKVHKTALAKGDLRTAGHAKQNKADALREIGETRRAKTEYRTAIKLYERSQKETGLSAKFHISGVEEKLSAL